MNKLFVLAIYLFITGCSTVGNMTVMLIQPCNSRRTVCFPTVMTIYFLVKKRPLAVPVLAAAAAAVTNKTRALHRNATFFT